MNQRRFAAACAVASLLAATTAACIPADVAMGLCDREERPRVTVPDDHATPWPASGLWLADSTTMDARGQEFVHDTPSSGGWRIGVKVHKPDDGAPSQRNNLCLEGGRYYTSLDAETTPWAVWHDTFGIVQENPNPTIVGVELFNTGDGIVFTYLADNWTVVGAHADGGGVFDGGYIHDDCIENDSMLGGKVLDSKLDGCQVFLSSTTSTDSDSPPDGTGKVVEVDGVLVRLQPYEQSFNPAKYGTSQHGGFFKWSAVPSTGTPPALVVRNSTFRSDTRAAYGGNSNGHLGLPPGTTCDNVMLVGTEAWPANDIASWTSQCTNLDFGTVADWDARTRTWDTDHATA